MDTNKERIEAQLAAYIDGDLSDDERQEIERHLARHPHHRQLLQELQQQKTLVQQLPRAKAPAELSEALCGQLERSALLDPEADQHSDVIIRINRWPQFAAVAAVVLLALGLGIVVYYVLPPSGSQGPLALNDGKSAAAPDGPRLAQTGTSEEEKLDRLRKDVAGDKNEGLLNESAKAKVATKGVGSEVEAKNSHLMDAPADKRPTVTGGLALNEGGGRQMAEKGGAFKMLEDQAKALNAPAQKIDKAGDSTMVSQREIEEFRKKLNVDARDEAAGANGVSLIVTSANVPQAQEQVAQYFARNNIQYMRYDAASSRLFRAEPQQARRAVVAPADAIQKSANASAAESISGKDASQHGDARSRANDAENRPVADAGRQESSAGAFPRKQEGQAREKELAFGTKGDPQTPAAPRGSTMRAAPSPVAAAKPQATADQNTGQQRQGADGQNAGNFGGGAGGGAGIAAANAGESPKPGANRGGGGPGGGDVTNQTIPHLEAVAPAAPARSADEGRSLTANAEIAWANKADDGMQLKQNVQSGEAANVIVARMSRRQAAELTGLLSTRTGQAARVIEGAQAPFNLAGRGKLQADAKSFDLDRAPGERSLVKLAENDRNRLAGQSGPMPSERAAEQPIHPKTSGSAPGAAAPATIPAPVVSVQAQSSDPSGDLQAREPRTMDASKTAATRAELNGRAAAGDIAALDDAVDVLVMFQQSPAAAVDLNIAPEASTVPAMPANTAPAATTAPARISPESATEPLRLNAVPAKGSADKASTTQQAR